MLGVIPAASHNLAAGAAHARWGPGSSAKDDASEAGEAQSLLRADTPRVWQPLRWTPGSPAPTQWRAQIVSGDSDSALSLGKM